MERIREELGIDRWVVFGGSWGSTLGLAYAETHPGARPGAGAPRHLPGAGRRRSAGSTRRGRAISSRTPGKPSSSRSRRPSGATWSRAYYRRLTSPDPAVRARAARAWSVWEGPTSRLHPDPKLIERFGGDTFAEAFARIECHYFAHGSFLRHPDQLLDDVERDPAHPRRHRPGALRRRVPGGLARGSSTGAGRRPTSTWCPTPATRRWSRAPSTGSSQATDRFRALP